LQRVKGGALAPPHAITACSNKCMENTRAGPYP